MNWIGQFHPQLVHAPIILLVFSALFSLVGLLFDRDWVKKSAVLLLVFGFLGAFVAVRSGLVAHRVPEHRQHVPEHDIDEHEDAANWVLWMSGAALLAVAVAARVQGRGKGVASAIALLLQLVAAATVVRAAHLGGKLVYEHGANVKIGGALVRDVGWTPADTLPRARPPGREEQEPPGR
jgi:uncharacterized membrane protein